MRCIETYDKKHAELDWGRVIVQALVFSVPPLKTPSRRLDFQTINQAISCDRG